MLRWPAGPLRCAAREFYDDQRRAGSLGRGLFVVQEVSTFSIPERIFETARIF